jgi:hypothetical protein
VHWKYWFGENNQPEILVTHDPMLFSDTPSAY